jgi:energy-coupling factor transport system permease protein
MSISKIQTVSRSTFFSRLDFRAKLALFIAASGLAALWDNPWMGAALTALVIGGCLAAGIAWSYLKLMLGVMFPFCLILLFTHGFFDVEYVLHLTGRTHLTYFFTIPTRLWIIGGRSLSHEGIFYGLNTIFKSLTFLFLVPLCIFTTDPNNLIVSLVRLRLPYKIVFVISATLRFFPLLFDEIQAVIESQRLRGFAFTEMKAWERVRIYSKIAVPVILTSMFKAQQMEVVLQSKAFSGSSDRTYIHRSELDPADWLLIVSMAAILIAAIVLYMTLGWGRFVM